MTLISTNDLASMLGCKKRQLQRMFALGDVPPGTARTSGGHWRIVDSDDLRKWVAEKARKFTLKRVIQIEKFTRKERRKAAMERSFPAFLDRKPPYGAILERRLARQIGNIMKTLEGLEALNSIADSSPSRITALVEALQSYSQRWEHPDGPL